MEKNKRERNEILEQYLLSEIEKRKREERDKEIKELLIYGVLAGLIVIGMGLMVAFL
jgi:hypothetical protein